jgi:aminoglycoside 2'-N-acetyltransferase I
MLVAPQLCTAPTDELSHVQLASFHQLLNIAFEGDFSPTDWQHSLGGQHFWLEHNQQVLAHAAVVPRFLIAETSPPAAPPSPPLSTGYLEAMATLPAHQRQGYGRQILKAVNVWIQSRYILGALSTSQPSFYRHGGWLPWQGSTAAQTPSGLLPTPEEDSGIWILLTPRSPTLTRQERLIADYRSGDLW